jgi:hypothetical protein
MQFGYPDHFVFILVKKSAKNSKSMLPQGYVADGPDLSSSPPPSRRRRKAIFDVVRGIESKKTPLITAISRGW